MQSQNIESAVLNGTLPRALKPAHAAAVNVQVLDCWANAPFGADSFYKNIQVCQKTKQNHPKNLQNSQPHSKNLT